MTNGIGRVGWRNFVPTNNPLWDNLKAYFTADNTTNDAKGTNNGVLTNGATYGTGKIGSGFSLDGINDYVGFASNWFRKSKTEPFTISSWVNSSNHYGAIFSNGVDDGHFVFIYGQYIYLQMGSGLYSSIRVVSASPIPLNTFKHITITYNGNSTLSGFKIYIDGVSVAVNIAQGEYGPLNNLGSSDTPVIASIPRIGARCDGAYPFSGLIDEVGIWDRVLTASEVTELYNAGAGKQYVSPTPTYPTSLKLFIDAGNPLSYPGTGTTVTDLTGTQNGTLVNGTSYSSSDGGSFVFDGVNDLITFAHNTAIKPTAKGTLSVMCKLLSPYTGVVLSTMDRNTYFKGVAIFQDSSPMRVQVANNGSRQSLTNSTPFSNVWKMITITWDGTTIKRYVNDALIDTVSQNIVPTTHTNPVTIGDMSPNDYPMKGNVSWAKIYDDAITLSDVQANFNSIKTRYGL